MDKSVEIDKDKIISELRNENSELKEQIDQQGFWFGTEASQKQEKELVSKNKELEAEVLQLKEEVASLTEKLNECQNARSSNKERILMQVRIESLQGEVNKLAGQKVEKRQLSAEEQKLIDFARDLKKKQTGKRESKRIPNDFIKEKLVSGCKPAEIHKALVEEKQVWCTLKTVTDRIGNMKKRGELPIDF